MLNLSMCISSGHLLLTACTTNNTFDTLASAVTRGNEVSQWFLNIAALPRPTSVVLTNTPGGGSQAQAPLKGKTIGQKLNEILASYKRQAESS